MRARFLIIVGVMTGAVAACSRPASESNQSPDTRAAGADPGTLPAYPASELATVSDLEAGVPPQLALAPRAARTTAHRQGPSAGTEAAATAAVAALVPAMAAATTTPSAATPLVLAAAPKAATPASPAGRSVEGNGAPDQPQGGSRGPVIIIRGGGGPNDPCAKHGPRMPGPGIAINNRLPPLRGGVLVNDRAPRMGGGGARTPSYPRRGGGIR